MYIHRHGTRTGCVSNDFVLLKMRGVDALVQGVINHSQE